MAKTAAKTAGKRTRNAAAASEPPGPPDLSHIAEGLRVLAMPIAEMVPDQSNARLHDDHQLTALMGSLRQFGQTIPLVVQAGTNLLRAGHGRLEAARRLYAEGDHRWAQMAAVVVQWDNATGTAYAIADNRLTDMSGWDKAALERQLREVAVGDEALQSMFSELAEELDLIVADDELEEPEGNVGEVPERFQILITCTDETHQRILLEELENRGVECRAVVS
jgi:ParB-like chromosome segregation protein Spo0J